MEGSIYEVPHNNNVPHIVEGKDLETLIVASIQTLKCNNKKFGKEEAFRLVQESVESEVTKEIFSRAARRISRKSFCKDKTSWNPYVCLLTKIKSRY